MATHSSVLVWRIPGTGELGGLPSMGSYRVGHDWSDLAAAAAEMYSVFVWYKFLPFTLNNFFSSVQSLSHVRLFVIPWTAACQPSPSITNSRSLLKFMSIQPSHPLLSPSPPAFNLSYHQNLFKWVSSSHQVAKVSSSNFSINPSNEYSGLISFRMDWFDLFAIQGTLKSLLQHHSSKASILQCSELMLFASLRFWIIYLILPIGTQNNVS